MLQRAAIYIASAVVAVGGIGAYAVHEHQVSQNLATQNEQLASALNTTRNQVAATRSQMDDLAAKLNVLASQPPPPPSPTKSQYRAALSSRRRAEAQLKKLQSQVDAQGKAIESTQTDLASTRGDLANTQNDLAGTRGDLANTRTELTGSIAHTHDELVLLEKRGERNYYEFDISKSKQFQREGPFGVRLRKANQKHQYANLELLVDDRNLSQKHVNLYQPVMFYTPDSPQPAEVVINSISKDHIHGYVSAPKYRQSELASLPSTSAEAAPSASNTSAGTASNAANKTTASSNSESSSRDKLSSPR
jgi:cob(I)alamin adenosyltransferase